MTAPLGLQTPPNLPRLDFEITPPPSPPPHEVPDLETTVRHLARRLSLGNEDQRVPSW